MSNDPRNAFSRAPIKYTFKSATHHGSIERVGSSDVWTASFRPNIRPEQYKPMAITAPNFTALVNKLRERFGNLHIVNSVSPTDQDRSIEDARQQVRAERFTKATETAQQEPVSPGTRLFGYDLRDTRGHQIANHEFALWVSQHQNDPKFNLSTLNRENLAKALTYLMESGQAENPTVDGIESAFLWLAANGYWEPKTYKRGQPRARAYVAPQVEPPKTPQQIYEEAAKTVEPYLRSLLDVTAAAHRAHMRRLASGDPEKLKAYVNGLLEANRLRKVPFDDLKRKYNSEMEARKIARKAAQ